MTGFHLQEIGTHNTKLGEPGQHPEGWMILNNMLFVPANIDGEDLWLGSNGKIYRLVLDYISVEHAGSEVNDQEAKDG